MSNQHYRLTCRHKELYTDKEDFYGHWLQKVSPKDQKGAMDVPRQIVLRCSFIPKISNMVLI